MCCPAGEHVNIEGEINFLQAAFPPSQTPSPAIYTWREGREGEWKRRNVEGEEGNENANCREMERVLNGKKRQRGRRNVVDQKKKT